MTSEDTTTPALVSRRTILRTGANAAWMVPAISIATAVPASAACSTATAAHYTISNPDGVRTNVTTTSWKQTHVVAPTASSSAGTATITLSGAPGQLNRLLSGWNISTTTPGWVAASSNKKGNSTFVFSKSIACGAAPEAVEFTVTYSAVGSVVDLVLKLLGSTATQFKATIAPQ